MVNYSVKYRKIIDHLVNKSFPLLKGRKIHVYEKSDLKFTADTLSLLSWSRIRLSPKARELSNRELQGILAHELSHIETYCRRGHVKGLLSQLMYGLQISEEKIIEEEHLTDKIAIDRGYGKQLYEQRRWAEKRMNESYQKFKHRYLSSEEIKDYMNKKISESSPQSF